jgi:hypothetical protein
MKVSSFHAFLNKVYDHTSFEVELKGVVAVPLCC